MSTPETWPEAHSPEVAQLFDTAKQRFDDIHRNGPRLSPYDDVERAMQLPGGGGPRLSPEQLRQVRQRLLAYALVTAHSV